MSVATLETGAVFAGKYRIDGVLGKGGMGVVYAATNLAVGRRVAIKVLDFGISGISRIGEGSGLTQTGVSMGTPQYMSPKQVKGERGVGPESDLYSVGTVLYHLLSGSAPFDAEGGEMATLARVLTEPHTPLRQVQPGVPVALGKLVDNLLVKDRAHRERDALEVRRIRLAVAAPDEEAVWAAAQAAMKVELAKGVTPSPGETRAERPDARSPAPASKKPVALIAAAGGGGRAPRRRSVGAPHAAGTAARRHRGRERSAEDAGPAAAARDGHAVSPRERRRRHAVRRAQGSALRRRRRSHGLQPVHAVAQAGRAAAGEGVGRPLRRQRVRGAVRQAARAARGTRALA
jgi:hypothetical protein